MAVIVADAGPLIGLSRIKRLSLLTELFQEVIVPPTVVDELRLQQPRPGVQQLATALNNNPKIQISRPQGRGTVAGLNAGESAAILLAEESHSLLLIDERRGRAVARHRGITVIGTGRVLLAAKEAGFISTVTDELDALQKSGYHLSLPLYKRLLEFAGEL